MLAEKNPGQHPVIPLELRTGVKDQVSAQNLIESSKHDNHFNSLDSAFQGILFVSASLVENNSTNAITDGLLPHMQNDLAERTALFGLPNDPEAIIATGSYDAHSENAREQRERMLNLAQEYQAGLIIADFSNIDSLHQPDKIESKDIALAAD